MAKCMVKQKLQYALTMTPEEKEYLQGILQNRPHAHYEEEPQEESVIRERLWKALNTASVT